MEPAHEAPRSRTLRQGLGQTTTASGPKKSRPGPVTTRRQRICDNLSKSGQPFGSGWKVTHQYTESPKVTTKPRAIAVSSNLKGQMIHLMISSFALMTSMLVRVQSAAMVHMHQSLADKSTHRNWGR